MTIKQKSEAFADRIGLSTAYEKAMVAGAYSDGYNAALDDIGRKVHELCNVRQVIEYINHVRE